MGITKYQTNLDVAQAGQVATLEATNIKSRKAQDLIGFGRAVFTGLIPGVDVINPAVDIVTLAFYGVFVTDNVINMKVNGVAIAPVTFSVDAATTKALLIAAIDAIDGINATDDSADSILIKSSELGNVLVTDILVTLGATQTGHTIYYSSSAVFEGVSILRHGQPIAIGGDDAYQINDSINVLTKGVVWVKVTSSVSYGGDIHVANDTSDPSNQGTFQSTGGIQVHGGKFVSSAVGTPSAPALAKIEINYPTYQ